jgi:hypothetical protein
MTGERGPEMIYGGRSGVTVQPNGGGTVNNYFTIQAPQGSVSRSTQQQIGAAAYRGAARAAGRNA